MATGDCNHEGEPGDTQPRSCRKRLDKIDLDDLADEQLPGGRLPMGRGYFDLKLTIEKITVEGSMWVPAAIILTVLAALGWLHH